MKSDHHTVRVQCTFEKFENRERNLVGRIDADALRGELLVEALELRLEVVLRAAARGKRNGRASAACEHLASRLPHHVCPGPGRGTSPCPSPSPTRCRTCSSRSGGRRRGTWLTVATRRRQLDT